MNPAQRYIKHRNSGDGHREAADKAGYTWLYVLRGAIFWLMFFGFLLYWTAPDDKQYTRELERVVAKCIDGGAVTIGDEVYLCNTYNTGERI